MFRVSALRKKHMNLKVPTGPRRVKIGFPAGKVSGDIVMRAIWNHYGTRGGASGGGWGGPIPPRPFLLNAMREHRDKYLRVMKTEARAIIRGTKTMEAVMRKLGALGQGDVQNEIETLRSPPNSPVTIRLKGSSNPLIDTGEMKQKVTFKVEP